METVEKYLEGNKDNQNFGTDFVKLIAFFTIPLSMFIAFLTRFNSEFQEVALPELKIGAVVSVGFFVIYQFAKWDDKRELKKNS